MTALQKGNSKEDAYMLSPADCGHLSSQGWKMKLMAAESQCSETLSGHSPGSSPAPALHPCFHSMQQALPTCSILVLHIEHLRPREVKQLTQV